MHKILAKKKHYANTNERVISIGYVYSSAYISFDYSDTIDQYNKNRTNV